MRFPAETAVVVDARVRVLFVVAVNCPAAIVVRAVALPLTWIVAVAVAELVVEYPAAATRIPEIGVTNPFPTVPRVLLSVVLANRADGKLYCRTLPIPAFPPKLIANPLGVAHAGTVPVDLNTDPATVLIAKNVVVPAEL